MAVRSSAGTGVVVALIVFVLTTVFLLVLSILLYSMKSDEAQLRSEAETTLTAYVKPQERSSDQYKRIEQAAGRNSVAFHLNQLHSALAIAVGAGAGNLEVLPQELCPEGIVLVR